MSEINFARAQNFKKIKKIVQFYPTYYSPSCKTARSSQNNGYAVKYTQIVAYDISIRVIVIYNAFKANSKLNTRACFLCKVFFVKQM